MPGVSVVGGARAQGEGAGVEDDGQAQLLRPLVDGPQTAVVGEEALVGRVQLDAAGALAPALLDLGDELLGAHRRVEADEGDELRVPASDLAGPGVAALETADHLLPDALLLLRAPGGVDVAGEPGEGGVGHLHHWRHVDHHGPLDAAARHQR